MSLPAARVRDPLGAGFSEKCHVFPLSTLRHRGINVVSLGETFYHQVFHFTQV